MTTISHNRRPRRGSSTRIFFFVFLFVLLCASGFLWRNTLSSVLWRVLTPVFQLSNAGGQSLGIFLGQFSSEASLSAQNAALRAQLASTSVQLLDRDALYQENLSLKSRLGRDAGVHSVLAGVLLRPPGIPYDTLMIDAGSQSGIVPGDFVSAGGTTIIGTVTDVYATASRVTLFSSPGESYEALLEVGQGDDVPVTVVGQGGGSLSAQVPATVAAQVGDSVVFPGVMSQFVGTVSAVAHAEGDSFETVLLSLPVNLFSLQFVEVLSSPSLL